MDPLIGILRNWSLLGGAQVLASLVAIVFTVVVSRSLGDVEFGRLYLALTVAAMVGVAGDLGLSQVVTRAVARERAAARPYLRRAALLVAVMGASLYLILLVGVGVLGFGPDVHALVVVFGLLVVAEAFAQLLAAFFAGHERMLVPALTRVTGNVIALALVVPVLLLGYGPTGVALVLVFAALVRIAAQLIGLRRLEGFGAVSSGAPAWRGLLRAGLPFVAVQSLGIFVIRIDVVILGWLGGAASVGWYGAASRLSEAVNVIPIVLTTATYPVLSRLWLGAPDEFRATARRTLQLVLVAGVPIAVTMFLLADDAVGFLLTLPSYAPTVPILRLQALTLPLIFVDYLLVCALMAIGRERTWLKIVVAACLFVPVLDWILISATNAAYGNGGLGAAFANLLTEVFFLVATLRALPAGTFRGDSVRIAVQAAMVGGLQALVLIALRLGGVPWLAAAAAAGAAYLVVALRTSLVPRDVVVWFQRTALRRGQPLVSPAIRT